MKRAAGFILALLTCSLVVVADAAVSDDFKGGRFDPPRPAPEFELQGSNGSSIKMSKFRGKVVALAFGFTYCPRICPVTLANLVKTQDLLEAAAADVQVIFVTVDPARDSPARLREFLSFFNPTFLGATGNAEQLETVRQDYGIMAKRAASENRKLGYEVHHSSFIYLIDREGNLRLLIPFGKPPEDIAHDIKLLLLK
jgi:protein SCO1/2